MNLDKYNAIVCFVWRIIHRQRQRPFNPPAISQCGQPEGLRNFANAGVGKHRIHLGLLFHDVFTS